MNEIERYEAFTVTEAVEEKPVEIVEGDDGIRTLVGYAVVWGAISDPRQDGYRRRFNRGSIQWAPTVNALWAHSLASPLASTANGTLRMTEDDFGVKVEIDLDLETTIGRDVFQMVKSRLVRGMSFGGTRLEHRLSFAPQVMDIVRFAATEVTVTISPAMTEAQIVTAENSSQLEKEKQFSNAKKKLAQLKLAMLKPSRVFG